MNLTNKCLNNFKQSYLLRSRLQPFSEKLKGDKHNNPNPKSPQTNQNQSAGFDQTEYSGDIGQDLKKDHQQDLNIHNAYLSKEHTSYPHSHNRNISTNASDYSSVSVDDSNQNIFSQKKMEDYNRTILKTPKDANVHEDNMKSKIGQQTKEEK
jgi:hypothetical protein